MPAAAFVGGALLRSPKAGAASGGCLELLPAATVAACRRVAGPWGPRPQLQGEPHGGAARRAGAATALAAAVSAAVLPSRRQHRCCRRPGTRGARMAAVATEHETVVEVKVQYLESVFRDVLGVSVPRKLGVFLSVLQASGCHILGRDEWRMVGGDLHPFILPMATLGALDDDIEVVGLLIRTPTGSALSPDMFQVVKQAPRKSWAVRLLATDMEKWIMKRAEEANFRKEQQDRPVIEATKDAYKVRFSGSDQTALDKWLLLEVGAFPEVYRNLAEGQLAKGDAKSALCIADTMRDAFGTLWGFPHAYLCRVLRDHFNGKREESREAEAEHSAVRCFKTGYPLWTLQEEDGDLQLLLNEAKMFRLGDVNALRAFYMKRTTDDQRAAVRTGSTTSGCATVAKAQALMDAVCCGHKSYNSIRKELSELYDEVPGCESLCEMIAHFETK